MAHCNGPAFSTRTPRAQLGSGPVPSRYTDWLPWKGPDGRSLSVMLPPGGIGDVWEIDGPAGGSNRRPWTRTGEPPLVTASPSILTPRYHGFLRNGVLTDSLGDRPLS